MKLFLDDERSAPAGWTRAHTVGDVTSQLGTGVVTELSLDYTLKHGETGADVLSYITAHLQDMPLPLPTITCHSGSAGGRDFIAELLVSLDARCVVETARRTAGAAVAVPA